MATTPTQHYSSDTYLLSQNLLQAILDVTADADPDDIDGWWDLAVISLLRAIVASSPSVSGAAIRYLEALARENRVTIRISQPELPNIEQTETRLRVVGPVGFKKAMTRGKTRGQALRDMRIRLSGVAIQQSLDVGRNLIQDTMVRNEVIVGWRRVTDSDPCYFCALLASRGAVYRSRETALFSNGDTYHPHCACHAQPLLKEEEEPASVQELYDFYRQAIEGKSGNEALNAFRRAWNKRRSNGAPK